MKKNFDRCLEMLLHHEGGFTADKFDPGNDGDGYGNQGSTNMGVTAKVYAAFTGQPAPIEVMQRHCQNKPPCPTACLILASGPCPILYPFAISKPVLRLSNSQ